MPATTDQIKEASETIKAVRLELPATIHRRLRVQAALQDSHMSALARVAVEEYLDRQEGKAGAK